MGTFYSNFKKIRRPTTVLLGRENQASKSVPPGAVLVTFLLLIMPIK